MEKSSGYKPSFVTGYVLTRRLLPQYNKLIDLHIGERHMVYSLLDDLNLGRRDFVSWV